MKIKLLNHQYEAINFIEKNKRCIIADDMGMGKTIESYSAIETLSLFPLLIVCPSIMKYKWKREIEKVSYKKPLVLKKGIRTRTLGKHKVNIINYELLETFKHKLLYKNYKAIIIDESHYAKNHKSVRSKLLREICLPIEYRILLSGTPAFDKPKDLIHQLILINRLDVINNLAAFKNKFINNGIFLQKEVVKLHDMCQQVILRRTKKEELSLPEKSCRTIRISLTTKLQREYQKNMVNGVQLNYLNYVQAQQMITGRRKINWLYNNFDNIVKNKGQIVIFGKYINTQKELYNMLDGKYAGIWIYGKQSEKFRQEQLKKFHDKKATFAIISMGCGGQGIDLVQSHCAFFIDLDWQPSLMLQAEDRLWRYGQKEKVEIFRMICNNTIDETIYDTVINKQEPLKILNGGNI